MHYFQKLNLGTFIPLMHNRNSKLFLNFDYASIFSRVASRNGGRVHERRHQKEHCTLHRHYVTAGPSTSPLAKNDPINRYGEIYGRLTQRGAPSLHHSFAPSCSQFPACVIWMNCLKYWKYL